MTPAVEKGLAPFDLGQHLFETINSMNRVRMMELGIAPEPKATPRERALDVRDDHTVYLLTLVADDLLRSRRLGVEPPLVALEMQAALNALVKS